MPSPAVDELKPGAHVHLVAVCGMGMSALAALLREKGFRVTGSDANVLPPVSDTLLRLGVRVMEGYSERNLDTRPDLVVIGNAISRGNAEAEAVMEHGIPYTSFPAALRDVFLRGREPIVITGTHGKTTTSCLLAWILESAGLEPGFLAGGAAKNFDASARLGSGRTFVVEGDEYDTAYFDKVPKFLHYAPCFAVLTGVEFDHADIYRDLDAIRREFERFVALLPRDGYLAFSSEDAYSAALAARAPCRSEGYGLCREAIWQADGFRLDAERAEYSISFRGSPYLKVRSPLVGLHNVRNTLAAVALCHHLGLEGEAIRRGIETFLGVSRRQEVRGSAGGVTIIDDFAHHPTAVSETLDAVARRYRGRRVVAVFEPRSNTSRRSFFQEAYVDAFGPADEVVIAGVYASEKIDPAERLDPGRIAHELGRRGKKARAVEAVDEIVDLLGESLQPGDIVVIMSNGTFGGIHEKLLRRLSRGSPARAEPQSPS